MKKERIETMVRHAAESFDAYNALVYPEWGLPTRKAADEFQCSCGDWLSKGMSPSDEQEHHRLRHGERSWRPEPDVYVSPKEEFVELDEQPDCTVLMDEICPHAGGRNYVIQYASDSWPRIIENCDGCLREK